MSKTTMYILVASVTFLVGVVFSTFGFEYFKKPSTFAGLHSDQKEQKLQRETPAEWESGFFRALEERTKRINMPHLRTVQLSGSDLEIRFWYDGLPYIINGFVIRRSGAEWSAVGIREVARGQHSAVIEENLGAPKSGWESAWKRLVAAGILVLPDESKVRCHTDTYAGGAYVVETNVNSAYRTYRYSNPQYAKCSEAKRMVLIEEIIADEFPGPESK